MSQRLAMYQQAMTFYWIIVCLLFSSAIFAQDDASHSVPERSAQIAAESIETLQNTARNHPNQTIELVTSLLKTTNKYTDTEYYADLLNIISYAEYLIGRYPESMDYAKQSELLTASQHLPKQKARSYVLQGNALQGIGLYRNAVATYQKAVSIYREENARAELNRALTNIGNTFYSAGQYETALKFYHQSLDNCQMPIEFAPNYLGIGNVLGQQKFPNKAIISFDKAHEYYSQAKDSLGIELALTGLANQYILLEAYNKAIELLKIAISSAQEGGRNFRVLDMRLSLAYSESQVGLEQQAIDQIIDVLETGKQIDDLVIQSNALHYLYKIYKKLDKYYEALNSLEQADQIQRQTEMAQTAHQLTVLQSILDLEQKNQKISQLSSANQLQQLKMEQQRTLNIAIIVGLLFIFTALSWLFYRHYQRKLLRRQLAINSRLEELNTLKTQLLANTSHELRTPLNGISGMSQLLLDNPEEPLTQDQAEMVEVIEQSSNRLLRLIEDLLDLSQLQAKRMTVNLRTVDLNQLFDKVVSSLKHLANEKELQLKISTTPQELHVLADEKRLEQILVNLIGNAIKFSDGGTITLKASLIDQNVELRVIDQGEGMPVDKLTSIFDPFTQLDASSSRKQQGSGLGLSITKELVLLHDSHLNVNSVVGVGTEFFFKLPTAKAYSVAV
jgi:signal transduction histidine kinase